MTSSLRRKYKNLTLRPGIHNLRSEYLVEHKYAARGKIGINGGSNGGMLFDINAGVLLFSTGLLVAACVNRAPEGLLGSAVAEVGVLDLLKVRRARKSILVHSHDC